MGRPPINIAGQKFGKLTAINIEQHRDKNSTCKWLCECECGGTRIVSLQELRSGAVTDCGCKKRNKLIGHRFGRLVVIRNALERRKNTLSDYVWECKCDCGKTTYVATCNLTSGKQVSCGCYRHERTKKHGLSGTRIERIFNAMKQRCFNPNSDAYDYYGGRGIKICDEWLGEEGFISFYNWAVENGYTDKLTIDRIDVNGDYCPENCKWTTRAEQMRNTRRNHYIEMDGETHTVAEWCRIIGIKPGVYYGRISRGYTDYDALKTPLFPVARWMN